MSYTALAHQGMEAVSASKWEEGISKLTQALQTSKSPLWLISRSRAYIGAGEFVRALADAGEAWHVAYDRANRKLMIEAHYRRAVAHFRLGNYANADCCCVWALDLVAGKPAKGQDTHRPQSVDEHGFYTVTRAQAAEDASAAKAASMAQAADINDKMAMATKPQDPAVNLARSFRVQCLAALERLPADAPGRKVTTNMIPADDETKVVEPEPVVTTTAAAAPTAATAASAPAAADNKTPAKPARLQDFQTDKIMSVSVLSKGVDKENLKVEFSPDSVRLHPVPAHFNGEQPLEIIFWGTIDPAASKYHVTPNKIEISLQKAKAGKWPTLYGSREAGSEPQSSAPVPASTTAPTPAAAPAPTPEPAAATTTNNSNPAEPTKNPTTASTSSSAAPAYPTSSKTGAKNWDSIGADEDKEDESEGVNQFFKKLYAGASPESQRAMMKSFVESNGTVLSTDWSDVQNRTVQTQPPEGVEAKKW